jgi:hypothetical protein
MAKAKWTVTHTSPGPVSVAVEEMRQIEQRLKMIRPILEMFRPLPLSKRMLRLEEIAMQISRHHVRATQRPAIWSTRVLVFFRCRLVHDAYKPAQHASQFGEKAHGRE